MSKRTRWTLRASFAHFGARATNPRWAWSARSRDGKTVVMTLWTDEGDRHSSPVIWKSKGRNRMDSLGLNDRLKNLIWARDNCNGRFRVVWTTKGKRGIAACDPDR